MRYFVLFFFLLFCTLNAQNNMRLFYEYHAIKDSTRKDKVSKEIMLLDITDKSSRFYSHKRFQRDSATVENIRKGMVLDRKKITMSYEVNDGETNDAVTKTYPDFKIYLHTFIGKDFYKVMEERKMKWKVLPEEQKIGAWNTQKATVEFAGRKWTAWFCKDIPISDGPYKFHGLPGLIVKMEDSKGMFSYELKGINKITDDIATAPEVYRKTELQIPYKTYKKLFWEHRKDPTRTLREQLAQNKKVQITFNDQEVTNPAMMLRIAEEGYREAIKRDNNHLEIDMLKEK